MSNQKALTIGVTILLVSTILISVYLYYDNVRLEQKITDLEKDKLKLILDSLKRNPSLSDEIKIQLEKLCNQFKDIDPKISSEIAQALMLFHLGKLENAITDLVKIMEYLLTSYYEDDNNFKKWLKEKKLNFDLHNLLTFCKEEKKITSVEFKFFIAVKEIRNKEVHEIDFKIDGYLNASAIIAAIGAIFKIASIVYPKNENISTKVITPKTTVSLPVKK